MKMNYHRAIAAVRRQQTRTWGYAHHALSIVNLTKTNMRDTHKSRLLQYLQDHSTITSLEAIRDLGNTRLAATVCTLRKEGYDIDSTSVEVPTRWGTTTQVSKYVLTDKPKTSFWDKVRLS